jgi:hypothetical protein
LLQIAYFAQNSEYEMSKEQYQGCLLKFGEKEHMESLYNNGLIYCNTVQYFANLKDENNIGDEYETAFEVTRIKESFLEVKYNANDEYERVAKGSGEFRQFYTDKAACGNLFCTYHYDTTNQALDVIEPIYVPIKINEWCVLIYDVQQFIDRFKQYVEANHIRLQYDLVKYTNLKAHIGEKSMFVKDLRYQEQKEFRFFIENPTKSLIVADIGSLQGIALLVKSDELSSFAYQKRS